MCICDVRLCDGGAIGNSPSTRSQRVNRSGLSAPCRTSCRIGGASQTGSPCLRDSVSKSTSTRLSSRKYAIHTEESTSAVSSRQQTKDGDTVRGRDEDLSVGDDRGDIFIAGAEVVTPVGRVVAVVELGGKIGRGVGVKHCGRSVLVRPDDGVRRAIRRDEREGSGTVSYTHLKL